MAEKPRVERTFKQQVERGSYLVASVAVVAFVVSVNLDADGSASEVFTGIAFVLFITAVALLAYATSDGDHVPELVCPHCQVKGQVYRSVMTRTSGVDGSKAAGAIMTGGASVWFTGLSGKHKVAEMKCKNCDTAWTVQR